MEYKALVAPVQSTIDEVVDAFRKGWILDPQFKTNPVRADLLIIYHLVRYSDKELEGMDVPQRIGKLDEVISIRSVPTEEADSLLEQGYKILEAYSKHVNLVKRGKIGEIEI